MCVELCNLLQKVKNNNKTNSIKTDSKRLRKKYKHNLKNEKMKKMKKLIKLLYII